MAHNDELEESKGLLGHDGDSSSEDRFTLFVNVTFLHMQRRQLERKMEGTFKKSSKWTIVWVAILLVLVFGYVGLSSGDNGSFTITLSLPQIGAWTVVFILFLLLAFYGATVFLETFRWMLVWLVLMFFLNLLIYHRTDLFSHYTPIWLIGLLIGLEVVTFVGYLTRWYIYPFVLKTEFFVNKITPKRWWHVKEMGPFTISYRKGGLLGYFAKRKSCSYRGQFDHVTGLPSGYGHWVDDARHGEIMIGSWKDGIPEAGPFVSREFSTGFITQSVQLAYVMATDDEFASNQVFPSNSREPVRCGVASIECSISGQFFLHLPRAKEIQDMKSLDEFPDALGESLRSLQHLSQATGKDAEVTNSIIVSIKPPHYLDVVGFTGPEDATSLEINLIPMKDEHHQQPKQGRPKLPLRGFYSSIKFPRDELYGGLKKGKEKFEDDLACFNKDLPFPFFDPPQDLKSFKALGESELGTKSTPISLFDEREFEVTGWHRASANQEVLIFVPGFNAPVNHALERLAQFVTMGQMPSYFKPLIFAYPGGSLMTYKQAKKEAESEETVEMFVKMLDGLRRANVTRVHIFTHSLGARMMLNAFHSPKVIQRFQQRPGFGQSSSTPEELVMDGLPTLQARTITMLNPDYSLRQFIRSGFQALRSVCDTITVVGDRKDQALFWSQFVNGFTDKEQKKLLGYCVHNVCIYPDASREKGYLDVDCIDTTNLEHNIQNLRHSSFSLNTVLVNDLHKLLLTGRRAKYRETLMHREGNVFQYLEAPECVVAD